MNENTIGDTTFCSFISAAQNVSENSYQAFAAKFGVAANRPAVLDALGKEGWALVCIDHDTLGTTWYFVRAK
jgi:hypothetical protein